MGVTIDYLLTIGPLVLAVFLDDMKIDVNSPASLSKGRTRSFPNKRSSIINSNQKYASSASSMTILNFEIKLAFDCAIQTAR